jgi:4a-hydroxytetrahydrobiopterin dehydratase
MRVDVPVAREHVEARLAAVLAADSDGGYWTLADQAGNRVCICAWPVVCTRPAAPHPR